MHSLDLLYELIRQYGLYAVFILVMVEVISLSYWRE